MPAGDDGTVFRGEAFFEIDENGNVIIETDNGSVTIDGVAYADKADDPHDLGGATHGADTLANLNSKVSDATLDDAGDTRTPDAHGSEAHNPEVLHDGENFDGQGTTELQNLQSVGTDDQTINQSIDATGLSLSGSPLNPTIPFTFVGSDGRTGRRINDETVEGDNVATIIATTNSTDGVDAISGYFFVYGRKQGSFDGFFDLVSLVNNRNTTAHLQNSRGTISRTYSDDGSGRLEVAIDDAGNTYDVSVQTIAADRA